MALPQSDSPPSLDPAFSFLDWKESAVLGTIGGTLSVAALEAITKKDFEMSLNSHKLVNICNKRKQSQFERLTRAFRVGGVRGGVCFATFMGVLNYLNDKRGVVDVHNFAASGLVTGAAFGVMMPVSLPPGFSHLKVLPVMMSSVICGCICYPTGWSLLKLFENQRIYINDLLKQSKEGESEQCDEEAV